MSECLTSALSPISPASSASLRPGPCVLPRTILGPGPVSVESKPNTAPVKMRTLPGAEIS